MARSRDFVREIDPAQYTTKIHKKLLRLFTIEIDAELKIIIREYC